MKRTIKNEDFKCGKCGIFLNPYHDEIIWNAADNPFHKECFKEPRNLPQANVKPLLCEVMAEIWAKQIRSVNGVMAIDKVILEEILSQYFT